MRSSMLTTRNQIIGVDVLRGVAIALVLGLHLQSAHLATPDTGAIGIIEHNIFSRGMQGVTMFFVVSGFLITRSTMARERDFFALSAWHFYLRRASRILPLLGTSIVIGIFGLALGSDGNPYTFVFHAPGAYFGAAFWLSIVTFTFNWARFATPGGWGLHWDVLWSLAVEEQFYLLFPLVILWARSLRRLVPVLLAAMMLALLTRFGTVFIAFHDDIYSDLAIANSFACLDALAIGILTALLCRRHAISLGMARLISVAGLSLGTVIYLLQNDFILGPFGLAISVALFIAGVQGGALFATRLWHPIAAMGELSYGIYLLHPLALYLAAPLLQKFDFAAAYIIALLATVMIAFFSNRFIERPAAAWMRGWPERRTAALRIRSVP
jgi:peptidoglycan/LPS O-acetylase OafA/YrhL